MQSDFMLKEAEKAVRNDLRNPKVPECLQWTVENVADFIESLNYPQYRVRCSVFLNFFFKFTFYFAFQSRNVLHLIK